MKRFLKAPAAFALAAILAFGGAGAAYATDEATPAPEVSAEAEVTPTEAPAVEEAVVPEEVAAPAPAEVVETPEVTPAPAEPRAEVQTTDAQAQAPPVQARTVQTGIASNYPNDANRPFILTSEGVKLTSGTFQVGGHVNTRPGGSLHIDGNNGHPGKPYIGATTIPWSALGYQPGQCVTWVQVNGFNYHFGENNVNRQGGVDERGWEFCNTGSVTPPTPPFEVKEVCATWETKSVNADWPQTILSKDCNYVPEQRCDPYKVQFDKYWIRDAADQAYFDSLTKLNSPADDARLEPHDYKLYVVKAKDCTPPLTEIPYPKLLANEVCGADNDTVYVDPEWVATYGKFVNGPWIDTKYKTIDGKRVVDGSAQIKPEFRKTHIWAGTAGTKPSDFTRWQMYPGTAPFVHEDTATVCPPVEVPANPKADITKVCGAADITLTNPQKDGEANKTASFVVNVDGTFYGAYAVEPNKSETVKLTFPEDSGDHKVEVFQSGTSEWKRIAKATVESDCIPPQPEDKIVFSEWVDGEYECTATEVPQTRTKSVTPYVLVDGKWVAGETVTTTENQTRPLTEAEQEAADIECAGPQPENKITETPWVDSEYQCGDSTVQITRQVTSTEYVREGSKWVEGESVTTTQTETRALTAEEIEAKNIECAGEQPPAKVVPGEWSKPVITCDNEEGDVLDITREVTTTPYIRVGAEWVLDTENAKTVTEEGTYTVTAEDIAALECETEEPPVVTPPVDEPKTPVKAAKPPVEIAEGEGFLATTGGDATPLWIGGIAILLAGAGIYLATRRRKVDAE